MVINDYKPVGKEGCFNISPSSLHSWFENKAVWAKSYILKEREFQANTNTVFGNICHAIAEGYVNGETLSELDVVDYLSKFEDNPDVDMWYIQDNWRDAHQAILEFMSQRPKPDEVEQQVIFEVEEGYTIGGTYDARTGSKITDYKTTSQKPSKLKKEHIFQLGAYAIMLELNGTKIDTLEAVYIVKGNVKGKVSEKTGKTIGVKNTSIVALQEPFTDEVRQMVKRYLKLLIGTLKVYKKQPELYEYLFAENPLSFIQD